MKVIADNGAYSAKAPAITGVAAMRHDTCYKYSDVKIDAKLVYTNKIPTGAFRGFGNPSAEWAVEQAIDLGAHALGIDPMESPASTPPKSATFRRTAIASPAAS